MAIVYGTGDSEQIDRADGVTDDGDFIYGFGGSDTIYGLGGNDWIMGGSGADEIIGGDGPGSDNDTASYSDSWEGVIVAVDGGGIGGTAAGDTLRGIESLTGSSYDDILTGNTGNNGLIGLDGADTLIGGNGVDTLWGDGGNDTLKGGGGADWLFGGDGIDTASYVTSSGYVYVSLVPDRIGWFGDAEGDHLVEIENLIGSAWGDWLLGDGNANVLDGLGGSDYLRGEAGNDRLYGGAEGDYLIAGADHDTLDGGTGADTMVGETGDDTYYVDSIGDTIFEFAGEGTDTVYALSDYTLAADVSVEILSLERGSAMSATGNNLANDILGNALDNVLEGGGGAGALSGLGGNDTFVFRAGQSNGSVVYEFQGNGAAVGDSLRFVGFGTPAGGASFTQASATEWLIHSGIDGHDEVITLYADAGAMVGATVHASDFIFV